MSGRPAIELSSVVLGASNAPALAAFYKRLLGWEIKVEEDHWVLLRSPDGRSHLSFQTEEFHIPPVWPAGPDDQQMMMHLDIGVDELDRGVAWAISCGARIAAHQPQQQVRVMLDPDGHPFCLFATDIPKGN